MRKPAVIGGAMFACVVAYLSLWPVPIDPVAWHAPLDRGYVGPFAGNDLLKSLQTIDLGDYQSPEDATRGTDGRIYVSTEHGTILSISDQAVEAFADVGGRPLGIESCPDGSLVVANAVSGLQRIAADGTITTLLDRIDGAPLENANNIGVGPDGTVYFSQSGNRFTAAAHGGSYPASLLDILEHGGSGSVYALQPTTGDVSRIIDGLNYANGLDLSDDGEFLLVAETGTYRILKHWLQGAKSGTTEVLIDNLPGFPDNIRRGLDGRYWIGFAAPRNALLDSLSDNPLLRKVIQRLPASVRPKAKPSSHVIAIDGNGEVLMNLHGAARDFPTITGVLESDDALYLTSLFGNKLARIWKSDVR